jgi:2-keto-4-pentenoate hydratase
VTATEAYGTPDDIAEAFVRARADGRALPDYPGPIPADLAAAYIIQDAAISQVDDNIVGWKVGRIAEPDAGLFGSNRLAGPIFARSVRRADGAAPEMPVFADGFAAAEAEFLCRIGTSPPARQSRFTMEEADRLVDAVHVGIEIASSPFPGINACGPAVTASDFGNNHGLVIGEPVSGWRTSGFERWTVATAVDGVEAGRATTETMLDGAIGAVRFLLELLAQRGIAVPAGTWVSTGAITGVHPVIPGQTVTARFGSTHDVSCRIIAA